MLFLRVFGKALLIIAFIAAAYDGARNLANPHQGLLLTSLSTHLKSYFPASWESLAYFFLNNFPGYIWKGIAEPLLSLPLVLLFSALGAALFLAGYRKPPPEILGD